MDNSWRRDLIPILNGLRSSSLRWVCTDKRKSFSISESKRILSVCAAQRNLELFFDWHLSLCYKTKSSSKSFRPRLFGRSI